MAIVSRVTSKLLGVHLSGELEDYGSELFWGLLRYEMPDVLNVRGGDLAGGDLAERVFGEGVAGAVDCEHWGCDRVRVRQGFGRSVV